jgi:MFS family permease
MADHRQNSESDSGKWMALSAALLGWLFDGFEIGMFPLVGPNALDELLSDQLASNPMLKAEWFGVIMAVFLVGAATGGVVFGWLGDRLGRVRAMSLSILTYAIFTGLCGFATEAWHIALLRFVASLGMGGEWSLGVALINELWPERSRALLAGLIGAAANVGLLMVGLLSLILVSLIESTREILLSWQFSLQTIEFLLGGDGWRLMMIAGALPALLTFLIRLFVPESRKWEQERDQGATSHWATRDLLGVILGAVGALVVVVVWSPLFKGMFIADANAAAGNMAISSSGYLPRIAITFAGILVALVGYTHPVRKYLLRAEETQELTYTDKRTYVKRMLLGACLAGIPLLGTWGSLQWAPKWAIALAQQLPAEHGPYYAKEYTMIAMASGAVLGTIVAALLCDWIGRRPTYAWLCVLSCISLVYLYQANETYDARLLVSVFAAGAITAAVYGWLPLYLPELFPTRIRATAQGFAFNFGRILSAVGSLQTAALTAYFSRGIPADQIEIQAFPYAGATLSSIYLLGLILIWFGPETKGKPLPA